MYSQFIRSFLCFMQTMSGLLFSSIYFYFNTLRVMAFHGFYTFYVISLDSVCHRLALITLIICALDNIFTCLNCFYVKKFGGSWDVLFLVRKKYNIILTWL